MIENTDLLMHITFMALKFSSMKHKLKKLFFTFLILLLVVVQGNAALRYSYIHENVRTVPYPQKGMPLYINPCALFVPLSMKNDENIQFALSCNQKFPDGGTLYSDARPWCMFNPHQPLKSGTWYWKFRNVSETGEASEWSETYSFEITDDLPEFVTPPFEAFLSNIPKESSRIYCFLSDNIEKARKNIYEHPEFNDMISQARQGIAADYTYDSNPYNKLSEMSELAVKLQTAYILMGRQVYAEKMVQFVRRLLSVKFDTTRLANDFFAGDMAFFLANVYETCNSILTTEEKNEIKELVIKVFEYYRPLMYGHEENHVFNNHFWQFPVRKFMQAALVFYDQHPLAKEYLEYLYEVWTCKAPAANLNRDGNWHNGTSYFSANAVTLSYMASLFSFLTGVDFLAHPWYQHAGMGLVYSWPPESLSAGFGDGHEKTNDQPLRIRSAFADFLARETGDPYATWYSSINQLYKMDYELRLYRMLCGKQRPADHSLPLETPRSVWFKDSGEMIYIDSLANYKQGMFLSFRSSPFGSGSHTHSNQNAFNIHYNGIPVYRSAGYYLNFGDAHNLMSYRHTRAHNTILVDGIGQPYTTRAYGQITRMLEGENIIYALGDASNAYCGISEYPMWAENFSRAGIAQTPENGFGETPLTKFFRHVIILDKDIVVLYDEMEAEKKVRWDWLLHSPVRFDIRDNTLITHHETGGFKATARLGCSQSCTYSQTNDFIEPPVERLAIRGERLNNYWHLKATFQPSKSNRILTVITIEPDGKEKYTVTGNLHSGNIQVGGWHISAELNVSKPASIMIIGKKSVFSYGKNSIEIEGGRKYIPKNKNASVLYDCKNGEWEIEEMVDRRLKPTYVTIK